MAEARLQRRLAAILAADVVGYSRLMTRDEAGTLAGLKARRRDVLGPAIKRHRGRIVKFMGDGVLAEFPSAVDAVECALALQRGFAEANAGLPEDARIVMRIGINLGDVIVEGVDLYGDGVNIAARLEPLADPGGVVVSGTVHDHVAAKLALAFRDLGEKVLKNIERPVKVYAVSDPDLPATVMSDVRASRGNASMKPSIAVLPFNNMSGDPEQEFFSDGITEDIITELSRFRDLHVVARNSSFTFKGKVVSIPEVGRELNVAYVLEGSVRRAGNRVRVTAQLIDAETGNHVWADRYDREVSDVFEVQDEITRKIVGMLTVGLEDDALERARRKHPENLAAYEHWLRGKRLLWTTGEHNIASRAHFAKAADLDPGFSRAHSGLAVTYQMEAVECLIPDEAAKARDNSYNSAMKAIQLDEADYQAHIALAWPLLYRRDYDRMKKHIDRAIQLNPNDADTLANAAYPLAMYGDAEAAVACGKAAIALNPRHPDWYMAFLATALFTARRLDEALEARRKASAVFVDSIFFYAALLGHLGHVEDARKLGEVAVSRLRSTPIGQQIAEAGCIEFMLQNNPYRLMSDREFFAEGMRMAGVPG